uniref:Uncharacterized protein n=1 Tax=Leersia perrieri TaxID=77586 RepID=A0A0D9VFU0_9ORYZ
MRYAAAAVPLVAVVAMLYARLAASLTDAGPRRLAAFLPTMVLLPILPLALPYYSYRGFSAFVFVWLGEFKLLLLAFDAGPLNHHPPLRPLPFVLTATLPIKLVDINDDDNNAAGATATATSRPSSPAIPNVAVIIVSSAIKVAAIAATVYVLNAGKDGSMALHR